MNKKLIVALFVVSLGFMYMFGRVQTLSKITDGENTKVLPANVETLTTATPQSTAKPQVINNTTNNLPTKTPERKKVQVTLSNYYVSGTYYCYEDKANLVTSAQTSLTNSMRDHEDCSAAKSIEYKNCNSNCLTQSQSCSDGCGTSDCFNDCTSQYLTCTNNCPKIEGSCDDKLSVVSSNVQNLKNTVSNYCP